MNHNWYFILISFERVLCNIQQNPILITFKFKYRLQRFQTQGFKTWAWQKSR
jgi:hypothetical protein